MQTKAKPRRRPVRAGVQPAAVCRPTAPRAFEAGDGAWFVSDLSIDGRRTAQELATEQAERTALRLECGQWLTQLLRALRADRSQTELSVLAMAPAADLDRLEDPGFLAMVALLSDLAAFQHAVGVDQLCTEAESLVETFGQPAALGERALEDALAVAMVKLFTPAPRRARA